MGDVYLLKTDPDLIESWNRRIGGGVGHSVGETAEGEYIVAGRRWGEGALLLRTDSAGNPLWEKTYGGERANSVRLTADGDYLVALEGGDENVLGIMTDGDGEVLQEFLDVGTPSAQRVSGRFAVESAGGDYLFVGRIRAGGAQLVLLEKFAARGTELLFRRFFGGQASTALSSVQVTRDGGYVVAGWRFNPVYSVYLAKAAGDGEILWERTFG